MQTDLAIHEPSGREVQHAVRLFRNVRVCSEARLLLAVRSRPIERFMAVAAWRSEGMVGRFQMACQPEGDRTAIGGLLLNDVESIT